MMNPSSFLPKLFLAVVPGLYPWQEIDEIRKLMERQNVGVLFSYYHFTKSKRMMNTILKHGFHEFFDFEGPIWMDSGAYSAWNSGKQISLQAYLQFITKISSSLESRDAVIVLDAIGQPRITMDNLRQMQDELEDMITLIPVVHHPLLDLPREIIDHSMIALGGMVRSFQINQRGSPHAVARWLGALIARNEILQQKHLHGLGLGSPLLQVALQPPISSLDWLGWRRNAAICEVYTPVGSKIVMEAILSRKILSNRPLTDEMFVQHAPPFISKKEELFLPGKKGFINRALWNAWWFLKAREYEHVLKHSRYVQAIKKNLQKGSSPMSS